MKSNKTYHFLFKYGFLIFGLLFLMVPIISLINPDLVEYNGKNDSIDKSTQILFAAIGTAAIVVFFAIKDKFRIVELNRQEIKVFVKGTEQKYDWSEIEKLSQIQFVYPPLYKLKFKNKDQSILFNTRNFYVNISGYTRDMSEMADLIKQKKKELGI